jgi:hypothetical protein
MSETVAAFSQPGLARRIVADRKAEEVEPHVPVDGVQSVTDPRLARFELHPDAAQPFLGNLPRSLNSSTRGVQHHEIIRINHRMWTVVLAEGGGDGSLQAMRGNEREQRDTRHRLAGCPTRLVSLAFTLVEACWSFCLRFAVVVASHSARLDSRWPTGPWRGGNYTSWLDEASSGRTWEAF